MSIRRPSRKELQEIAEEANFSLNEEEVEEYADLVAGTLDAFERLQEIPEPQFAPHDIQYTSRTSGYRPTESENPHNIWITKCTVEGRGAGPLAGRTVGLKDNISLAGVEMTLGSRMLEGYTPTVDATIVDRILDAGGLITGKLNMESFAFSASSDTSDFGTVTNPRSSNYIAGGSSSGSAAAIAADEVDIAIGGDQGGSIRIPASCCGIVGLKPTTGLVPYTGVFPIDNSLDHVGPMAGNVEDVATTLEVMAGSDGLDPRQPRDLAPDTYTESLVDDVSDTTIALLKEGFEREESCEEVNEVVRDAIDELEALGAEVTEVSIPQYLDSLPIWIAIGGYGGVKMYQQGGVGLYYDGWYNTDLATTYEQFRQSRSNDFPPTVKSILLAVEYLEQIGHGDLYAKAQNISLQLRDEIDRVLENADVIALPTLPMEPLKVDPNLGRTDRIGRSMGLAKNTSPFDITHHPAISVPCGSTGDCPVGLMLASERFDESKILRVAYTYEQNVDWKME